MHPGGASAPAPPAPIQPLHPDAAATSPVAVVEEPAAAAVTVQPAPVPAPPVTEASDDDVTTTVATSSAAGTGAGPAAPAPASPTTPGGVEAMIREVWPDDLEARALSIARERPAARGLQRLVLLRRVRDLLQRQPFVPRSLRGDVSQPAPRCRDEMRDDRLRDVQGLWLESVVADRSLVDELYVI